jgi:hypothetical protein
MTEKSVFHVQERLIGGFIPQPMAERLALVTTFRGVTRAKIIRDYIKSYLKKARPDEEMIQAIAKKAFATWYSNQEVDFEVYREQIEGSLGRKKISEQHIQLILREVDQLHEETKTKRTSKISRR